MHESKLYSIFSQFGRLDDQTLDLNLDMGGRGVSHLIPSRVSLIWTSDTRLHFSESWNFLNAFQIKISISNNKSKLLSEGVNFQMIFGDFLWFLYFHIFYISSWRKNLKI